MTLGLPVLVLLLLGHALPTQLIGTTQVLASSLFCVTGVLCLVGWRLVGYARSAYIGCCFAVLGVLTLPLPLVGALLPDESHGGLLTPLAHSSIALAVIGLAMRSLRSPAVNSALRPLTLAAETLTSAAILYAALSLLLHPLGPEFRMPFFGVVDGLAALGLMAVGITFAWRDRGGRIGVWSGSVLILLGARTALRLTTDTHAGPWMPGAAILTLVASGVAVTGAASGLLIVLRQKDRSLHRLSIDLRTSESRYEDVRHQQEERLHDVRSALAGIRCATGTLHRYASHIDERTRTALEGALLNEITRLEGLVDPADENLSVNFALAEIVNSLAVAERSQGSEILVNVGDLAAYGRPADTAAVLQNLIVNARRYAPGSVIAINAIEQLGRIQLQVEDSGPGIPEADRATIFQRGVRGSTSTGTVGTGLGLYVSRRLMTGQQGSLTVREGAAGGACFVLELPAAGAVPAQRPGAGEAGYTQPRGPVEVDLL